MTNLSPRERWYWIFMILKERNIIPRAEKADKGSTSSLALDVGVAPPSCTSSYTNISLDDEGKAVSFIFSLPWIYIG